MMKERPILFSGPMVQAILAGRKTQTRRVVGPLGRSGKWPLVNLRLHSDQFSGAANDPMSWGWPFAEDGAHAPLGSWLSWCPYGELGDRLWVRETFCDARQAAAARVLYRADGEAACRWTPGIHMPRALCRLVLDVTDVRVERLHSISRKDAAAEGVCWAAAQQPPPKWITPSHWPELNYIALWDHINGRGHAAANPWVWVVEFKRA